MRFKFTTYQECRSTEGWQPVKVQSSEGDQFYVVLVNPWGILEENICECKGYVYRGQCRHQGIAHHKVCRWSDEKGPEVQSLDQEDGKICPRCGGPTKTAIEVVDE
jgi:hypothetical protein